MDCQKNTKENIVFGIKSLVPIKVLTSIALHYITQLLYLRACVLSYNQQQVQQYVLKRHGNIIHELFFRSKRTTKVTPSSITIIGLVIHIKDPEEASSVNHIYIEEDTEIEKTTMADIITTTHLIGSNTISIINLNTSQVSIQQKRDNKYILNINNMPNMQESKKLYQPSIIVSLLYKKEQKIFQIIIKEKQTT